MMTLERAAGEGGGFTTSAKLKLDELFVTWLSYADTYHFISHLLSSFKGPPSPSSPDPSPSASPVPVPPDSPPSPARSLSLSPRKSSPRRYIRTGYARSPPDSLSPLSSFHPHPPTLSPEPNGFSLDPPASASSPSLSLSQPSHPRSPSPKIRKQPIPSSPHPNIPRFYFPPSHPQGSYPPLVKDEPGLARISLAFEPDRLQISSQEAIVALAESTGGGLPKTVCRFLIEKFFSEGDVSESDLSKLWKMYISGRDAAGVLFEALKQAHATSLKTTDFRQFLRLILNTHPGLSFLADTPVFQERYLETILVRIFYSTPKGYTGKMGLDQLRRSGLMGALAFIDSEEDINKSIEFFSYEHFYVIYCKFWEIDTDHDLVISADDLMRYSGGPPTRRIAERISSNSTFPRDPDMVRLIHSKTRQQHQGRGAGGKRMGLMTYQDFVWYILSEEERESTAALEYWFRMLDLDEDGYWSSFELEYFYKDMMPHLRGMGMEPPLFEDLLCQWLDMLSPNYARSISMWDCPTVLISLSDLRKSKLGKCIIHSLVSPRKFMAMETRDPFADPGGGGGMADWLRFAQAEYELAVADQASLDQSFNPDEEL